MALMKKTQRSFAGGMIDKDLTGRQDLNKYSQGCLMLQNFKVRKQGNVIKRSGTDLVCDFSSCLGNLASDAISTAKLVPLIQERENGFYMLLTGKRAFLISPSGMKMTNGTWSKNPSWSGSATWSADSLPEGHAFDTQPSFSNGTWTWTDTGSQAWTASGASKDVKLTFKATINNAEVTFDATFGNDATHTAPYSIEIPFDDNDLSMIDWCQSGDTVFFAHRSYPPCRIVYTTGSLEYKRIQFRQGLGTPPRISNAETLGTNSTTGTSLWSGTGGTVHLEYCVTAVKDGIETGKSVPYAMDYNAPWPTGGTILLTIDTSGMSADDWDCFYIYKKISDVFGLIGTTSNQTAIVDVSAGFSVDGALVPDGFTTFDKNVHLRESNDNPLASCSYEHGSATVTTTATVINTYDIPEPNYTCSIQDLLSWISRMEAQSGTSVTQYPTVRSGTSSKLSANNTITFTINASISSFKMRVGCVLHDILKSSSTTRTLQYYWNYGGIGAVYCPNPSSTVTDGSVKWTGQYTYYYASEAKYYKARVEYFDGSAWLWSSYFNCTSEVDQSNPGSGWVEVVGSAGVWRKEYAASEHMISYSDAASVIVRMDAHKPTIPSVVNFTLPLECSGKQVRNIEITGLASANDSTNKSFIVNGIVCMQNGKFVNTFTDENITPDLTITPPGTEDHFVSPGEYPGCVQLYSQRLVYAASANYPFTFWMSCTGDLYNFDVHEYVRASDAITASTAALEMPRINRMLVHRDLMLFSEGGEWQVAPSTGNAVAPSTIAAKLQSTVGCASWLKPIPVDSDIIFCDSSGETLMSTRYNFASDGYESSNLSVLSQRIFRNNAIVAMAYAQFPESTIECVLSDGTIASLVYMKEHEVCAWSKHVLGGSWKAIDVAANKSVVYGSSNCAFVTKRTYDVTNGNTASTQTEWAVLGLRDIDPNDITLLGNIRMDAVRTMTVPRTGSDIVPVGTEPAPTIEPPTPGYEEMVVKIGETRSTTDGTTYITGDVYAVGCAFTSVIKTTSPEFTDKETAQMEIKNATESEIRVIDGSDFTVRKDGVPAEKATQMKVPYTLDVSGETYTLIPGDADCKLPLVGTNTTNGSVVIEHNGYLPLAILSVSTAYRIEYANHANGGSQNGNG